MLTQTRLDNGRRPPDRIGCPVPGCLENCDWQVYSGDSAALRDAYIAEVRCLIGTLRV